MSASRPLDPISNSPHARSRLALAIFCALLLAAPIGCGDDKADSGDSGSASSADYESMRDDASGAREAAVSAQAEKYAAEDFQKAQDYFDQASDFESDEPGKAKTYYRRAKKKFEEAMDNAERDAKKFAKFEERLKEYETTRDQLKEAGADTVSPDLFSRAQTTYEAAKTQASEGELSSAQKKLNLALRDLETLKNQNATAERMQASADTEKESMQRAKDAAIAEDAATHAADDWKYATGLETDGDARYASKDFRGAQDLYSKARMTFDDAARHAVDKKNIAAATVKDPDGGGRVPRGNNDYGEIEAGEIKIPEISGHDFSMADLPGFFHGVVNEEGNGVYSFSWASGLEFKEDVNTLNTKHGGDAKKAHLLWEGMDGVGNSNYVFAGNTEGILLLNASFEDAAAIRASVQFQMVEPKGYWEMILMAEKKSDGYDYYSSQFGANLYLVQENGRIRKPLAAPAQPEYRKAPKDWVSRIEPYEMIFQYIPDADSDEGTLECKINGETTAKFKTGSLRKGTIGFRWHRVKFYVESLDVRGQIDREWAEAALEERAAAEEAERNNPGAGVGF